MLRKKYRTRIAITDYERSIEDLIPQAEKEARLKVVNTGIVSVARAGIGGRTYNHCFKTQFFHEAMTRLAIEKGFRSF